MVIPEAFGYDEITFDIQNRLNISKPIFIYINDEKSIKIEQIRDLQLELTSPPIDKEQIRVVIIHPLERLLHVAQQSLLKLLEEPPERTAIFLVGNSTSNLAETILSRCEVIQVVPPNDSSLDDVAVSFWKEVATNPQLTSEQLVILLSAAPEKKDEALIWIRKVLQNQPTVTATSAAIAEALTGGYEALLSNVSPKLVWGRVVYLARKTVPALLE